MKRIIFVWVAVLCAFASSAQMDRKYTFIKYDTSAIFYPGDSSAMLAFYAKLDALRNGERNKLVVAHFGGSHIQAGVWSETLADSFQALGGFVGGGAYLFPYRLLKTNGPPFYKSHGSGNWNRCRAVPSEMCEGLGMSGMSGTTYDSTATFGFTLRPNEHIKSFHYIKLYHNFNADYAISIPESFLIGFQRRDFPDGGYSQFHFDAPIDSVTFQIDRIGNAGTPFIFRGWVIENENPGIAYISVGVNGASTRSYIQCTEFAKEIGTVKPDLVVFSIGVNDAQDADLVPEDFFARYDSLCNIIKAQSPDCAILFTTISDNYIKRKTKNTRSLKVNTQIKAVAEKQGAGVWDMYTVMGGLGSIDKWYRSGLASPDRIHFNNTGYTLIGNLMFQAIMENYALHTTHSSN